MKSYLYFENLLRQFLQPAEVLFVVGDAEVHYRFTMMTFFLAQLIK